MLKFHADKFVSLSSLLGIVSIHFLRTDLALNDDDKAMLKAELPKAIALLGEFGLTQSVKKAIKILGHTDFAGYDKAHYSVSLDELKERIRDELEDRYCLCLDAGEAMLYEPKQSLVGPLVEKQFPSLLYEIDESLKCGGLGRDTASAFHAIRCLEGAIGAIAKCLGIPDPIKGAERNWTSLLGKIDAARNAKWPNAADRFKGDGKLFDDLYGTLHAMQNPYRNATMHLDAKYSKGEAEMIRIFVREFLLKVSSRMDENGQPSA